MTTDLHNLCLSSVGLPRILVSEEAKRSPFVVPLAVNGAMTSVTFRNNAQTDFWIDSVTAVLWNLNLQNNNLDFVEPERSIFAPVYMEFYDGSAMRAWQTYPIHWCAINGLGRTPHYLNIPAFIGAGCLYTVRVFNYHPTCGYYLSLQLNGRSRRPTRGVRGENVAPPPEYLSSMIEVARASDRTTPYLTGDNYENLRGPGVSKAYGIPEQPITSLAGTFAVPSAEALYRIRIEQSYDFFLRYIKGSQNPCVNEEGPADIDPDKRWAIFAEIRETKNNWHLSHGYVPMAALCGWAGQPHILPVDWWLERGDELEVRVVSLCTRSAGQPTWTMMFEGWGRK